MLSQTLIKVNYRGSTAPGSKMSVLLTRIEESSIALETSLGVLSYLLKLSLLIFFI